MTKPQDNESAEQSSDNDYFPYLNMDEKVTAYKTAISHSLDLAVHPEHLKRVRSRLEALETFWTAALTDTKHT